MYRKKADRIKFGSIIILYTDERTNFNDEIKIVYAVWVTRLYWNRKVFETISDILHIIAFNNSWHKRIFHGIIDTVFALYGRCTWMPVPGLPLIHIALIENIFFFFFHESIRVNYTFTTSTYLMTRTNTSNKLHYYI